MTSCANFPASSGCLVRNSPNSRTIFSARSARTEFFCDHESRGACTPSIRHYADIGIQLFNPGIQHTVDELKEMCGNRLTLLHGIPPRDVLALGTPADVSAAVRRLLAETADHSRLILSCAGGMPPDVSTENLRAFIDAARRGNLQVS